MNLFALLEPCNDAQVGEVIARLNLGAHFPPVTTPLATRRAALAEWGGASSKQEAAPRAAVAALGVILDPAAWLEAHREKYRYLWVLGLRTGDARYQLKLSDLFVDVEIAHGSASREHAAERGGFGQAWPSQDDEAPRDLASALEAIGARPERGSGARVGTALPPCRSPRPSAALRGELSEDCRKTNMPVHPHPPPYAKSPTLHENGR